MGRALAMMREADAAEGGGGGGGAGGGGGGGAGGGGGGGAGGGDGWADVAAGARASSAVSRPPILLRTAADKELIEAVQAAFRSSAKGAPPNAQLMEQARLGLGLGLELGLGLGSPPNAQLMEQACTRTLKPIRARARAQALTLA